MCFMAKWLATKPTAVNRQSLRQNRTLPEVVDCCLITGNRDYLLRVATTGLGEFERFLVGRLTKVRGVASIESSIPLRRVKGGLARIV